MSLIDSIETTGSATRRLWLALAAALGAALIAMGLVAANRWVNAPPPVSMSNSYFTVVPIDLDIALHCDGSVSAVNNTDITCPVEGQNTIQTIVPEGNYVKKGQVICTLDPTEHQRTLATDELDEEKAVGDVKWSKEQKAIEDFKNDADLAAANSELVLAQIDLKEYTDGEYPADLKEAQRKLEMADLSLKKKEEVLASSKKLFDSKYITLSEVQASELEVITARNEQEKAVSDLSVLKEFKHAKDLAEKQDKVAQAVSKVERTKQSNASDAAQKDSDLATKTKQLELHKAAADHSREQFANCTIKAPADGMVLYASSVQEYFVRDQPIQAGAKVMEQQLIIRLPEVSQMKAVVNVAEGKVGKLKVDASHPIHGKVKITGVPAPVDATMTKVGVLPDSSQRWWNPDSKFYPVDLTLDQTPPDLKPGTSAKVDLTLGKLTGVLAVPVGAIFSKGDAHYVFVKDTPRALPHEVTLGESTDTMVQLLDGVKAGDDVVLLQPGQGQDLLDLAGIKTPTSQPSAATTQPSSSHQ